MKNSFLIILLAFIVLPVKANLHNYYVSITSIEYNNEKQNLDVKLKLFYDDLQYAIEVEYGETIKDPITDYEDLIKRYTLSRFSIAQNGIPLTLHFEDVQSDVEVVWVSLSSDTIDFESNWTINSSLFVDLFADQVNLINFYPNQENYPEVKGLALNSQKRSGNINFNH